MNQNINGTRNVPLLYRLFVAIDLPQPAVSEIIRVQDELKKANLIEGAYTNPNGAHVTLKFIGFVAQDAIVPVKQLLKTIYFAPFTVTLGKLGFFGNGMDVRIIWLDLFAPELKEMTHRVNGALRRIIPPDTRPFQSHLTLARVKSASDSTALHEYIDQYVVEPVSWAVTEFVLKRSVLTPQGAIYTDLETYPAQ